MAPYVIFRTYEVYQKTTGKARIIFKEIQLFLETKAADQTALIKAVFYIDLIADLKNKGL
jgi:hypothetical protein